MLDNISKRAVEYFTKSSFKTPPPPPVVEIEVAKISVSPLVKNDPLATSLFDNSNNILMLAQWQLNYMYLYHFFLIVLSASIVYLLRKYIRFFNDLGWFDSIWLSGIIFCGLGILMIEIGVYREFLDWLLEVREIP